MKLILEIVILSFGLFLVGACKFQYGTSVEAVGSTQPSRVGIVYPGLTLTPPSISKMVAYPEAEGDIQLMMNQSEESIKANRSLLSVWAGPDGLFIRHIYLR